MLVGLGLGLVLLGDGKQKHQQPQFPLRMAFLKSRNNWASHRHRHTPLFWLWCSITKASAPWKTQTGITIPLHPKDHDRSNRPQDKKEAPVGSLESLLVPVLVPRENEIDLETKNCFPRLPLLAAVERTPVDTYAPVSARSKLGHLNHTSYYSHLLPSPRSRPYNKLISSCLAAFAHCTYTVFCTARIIAD